MPRNALRSTLAILGLLALLAPLPGCVAAAGVSAVAVGYQSTQDRGLGGAVSDATIKTAITASYAHYDSALSDGIDVEVYEGRVLLTGRVPKQEQHDLAVRTAWKVKGVTQVYDEVKLGPVPSSNDDVNDGWISTRLRNELLWDSDVRSINYTVTTSDHVVYLIGSAQSREELDRVTAYARNVPNVRRVVSYVQIRPEKAPAPAAAEPAPPVGGGDAASSTPGSRIEVTPLQ
ncbi:MAG TPA: BON domain-containing protein [Stellaceae bacterium]|nr:BON domain-containing protein [Stellaceae bacterium]